MKILFDHKSFQSQKIGGVSKALTEMINRLPEDINIDIAIKESDNLYLHEEKFINKLGREIENPKINQRLFLGGAKFRGKATLYNLMQKYNLIKGSEKINDEYCDYLFEQGKYDIFQPTHYNSYFLKKNKKPFVQIVHDVVPELFPEYFPNDFFDIVERKKIIPRADHIIAISENTKKDILERWNIPEDKISVIYWGSPDLEGFEYKKVLPYPYILYVGGRDKYKRFRFFVKEIKEYLLKNKDVQVVCTGVPFNSDEKSFLKENGIINRFHTLLASTDELNSLYHFAICFVFPSLYEGFGLPTLEAMANGCPVIISDSSCFPEIGGDAAYYIESSNNGESNLSELLDTVTNLSDLERNNLVIKCKNRAREFTWDNTACEYARVYRSLI